jgi:hypothetical protein
MQYCEFCDVKPSSRLPLLAASAGDDNAMTADATIIMILVDTILLDMISLIGLKHIVASADEIGHGGVYSGIAWNRMSFGSHMHFIFSRRNFTSI